ncbi:MAG: GIY-YIG nuclease family protein [Patescibacteria group bacterium]
MINLKEKAKKFPKSSGVYFFKDKNEKIIYVGKASILKNRVSQYFQKNTKQSLKTKNLIDNTFDIDVLVCESEIDALIQEAYYIKKYNPKYNVLMRDDKNYFFVGITKEEYPRIFITHQPLKPITNNLKTQYIGPFTDGFAIKETLKLLRKIFPYRHCIKLPKKACLQYHLGRCPAPCLFKSEAIDYKQQSFRAPCLFKSEAIDYKQQSFRTPCIYPEIKTIVRKNIKYIKEILKGEKKSLLKNLEKEMIKYAKKEMFEKAGKVKKQIENIKKIFEHKYTLSEFKNMRRADIDWQKAEKFIQNLLNTKKIISRVEAYDISNISGKYAVGSMVVFTNGIPDKREYRKFKIKFSGDEPNDPKMMKEVLMRRLKRKDWPKSDLIILDGGITQLNAVKSIANKKDLIISLAKRNEEIHIPNISIPKPTKEMPEEIKFFFQQIRDEAHRFAITFHKKLRGEGFLKE